MKAPERFSQLYNIIRALTSEPTSAQTQTQQSTTNPITTSGGCMVMAFSSFSSMHVPVILQKLFLGNSLIWQILAEQTRLNTIYCLKLLFHWRIFFSFSFLLLPPLPSFPQECNPSEIKHQCLGLTSFNAAQEPPPYPQKQAICKAKYTLWLHANAAINLCDTLAHFPLIFLMSEPTQ